MTALRTLAAPELIEAAVDATRLTDFGPEGWRDGLDVLLEAANLEAQLNEVGLASQRYQLQHHLENRLGVFDWRARHTEIGRGAIAGPVVITGLPRTGTSALSNLLAQDPATRSLRNWESQSPVPPPEAATEEVDPRIHALTAGMDMMFELFPRFRVLHDDSPTGTAELIDLLGMSFRTQHFTGTMAVPSYARWWLDCDMTDAYGVVRDTLQLLQWRRPPNRWHLKNPGDIFCLDAVLRTFPDVRFVWTHRDPVAVLASVSELVAEVHAMGTDDSALGRPKLGGHLLDFWSEGIERAMAFRDRHPDRFIDLAHSDLRTDAVTAIAALYDGLGWDLTAAAEAGIRRWIAENPPGRHGSHHPNLADYGLTAAAVSERFADYSQRFDL